jgi:hypothetical protein
MRIGTVPELRTKQGGVVDSGLSRYLGKRDTSPTEGSVPVFLLKFLSCRLTTGASRSLLVPSGRLRPFIFAECIRTVS